MVSGGQNGELRRERPLGERQGWPSRFLKAASPEKLFGGAGGVGGLLLGLLFGHLLGGVRGVLGEREGNGAEGDAEAERKYEKLFHAVILLRN